MLSSATVQCETLHSLESPKGLQFFEQENSNARGQWKLVGSQTTNNASAQSTGCRKGKQGYGVHRFPA